MNIFAILNTYITTVAKNGGLFTRNIFFCIMYYHFSSVVRPFFITRQQFDMFLNWSNNIFTCRTADSASATYKFDKLSIRQYVDRKYVFLIQFDKYFGKTCILQYVIRKTYCHRTSDYVEIGLKAIIWSVFALKTANNIQRYWCMYECMYMYVVSSSVQLLCVWFTHPCSLLHLFLFQRQTRNLNFAAGQGDQTCLRRNGPRCGPTNFLSKLNYNLDSGLKYPYVNCELSLHNFIIFTNLIKKLP